MSAASHASRAGKVRPAALAVHPETAMRQLLKNDRRTIRSRLKVQAKKMYSLFHLLNTMTVVHFPKFALPNKKVFPAACASQAQGAAQQGDGGGDATAQNTDLDDASVQDDGESI